MMPGHKKTCTTLLHQRASSSSSFLQLLIRNQSEERNTSAASVKYWITFNIFMKQEKTGLVFTEVLQLLKRY